MESLNFEQNLCPRCHNPMDEGICRVCATENESLKNTTPQHIADLLAEYQTRLIAVFNNEAGAETAFEAFKAQHDDTFSGLEHELDLYNDVLWDEWKQLPDNARESMERTVASAFNVAYQQRKHNQ